MVTAPEFDQPDDRAWFVVPDTDPLADVLDKAMTGKRFNGEDGSTSVYFNDGAHLARVAREHIAAEIEASIEDDWPTDYSESVAIAARIARGGT